MNLDDFLNDPEYADLLRTPENSKSLSNTEIETLIEIFNDIKDFYLDNGRLPEESTDFNERQIYSKYMGLINNPDTIELLKEYDDIDILKPIKFNSLDDALNDPDLSQLLHSGPLNITKLKYVKKFTPPDYIAKRKKCENFSDYEHLFIKCHEDLRTSRRQLMKFSESQVEKGKFYIIKGMLCYISHVDKLTRNPNSKSRNLQGRLLVIFENGTQSDLLLQSLMGSIFKNKGLMVSVPDDETLNPEVVENVRNGSIYIAKSLIDNEEINEIKNLYKIGYTTETTKKRTNSAENQSTYLYAPVKILAEYDIMNASAEGVEKLLHKFFNRANLKIEIDNHNPREWFIVPLPVIDQAINLIISGQIIHYKYNFNNQEIELKPE